MDAVNALIEELRTLVTSTEYSVEEKFKMAMDRMAGFLAGTFGVEQAEVGILWKRGNSLSFLWPDFLAEAKELPVKSRLSVAANILRTGLGTVLANMHHTKSKGSPGLKYREIARLPEFTALKMKVLG